MLDDCGIRESTCTLLRKVCPMRPPILLEYLCVYVCMCVCVRACVVQVMQGGRRVARLRLLPDPHPPGESRVQACSYERQGGTRLSVCEHPDGLRFDFNLPPGSYATVLMREVMKCVRQPRTHGEDRASGTASQSLNGADSSDGVTSGVVHVAGGDGDGSGGAVTGSNK